MTSGCPTSAEYHSIHLGHTQAPAWREKENKGDLSAVTGHAQRCAGCLRLNLSVLAGVRGPRRDALLLRVERRVRVAVQLPGVPPRPLRMRRGALRQGASLYMRNIRSETF